MPRHDARRNVGDELVVEVDWAPPYELFASITALRARKALPTLELGPDWLRQVRQRLPPDMPNALSMKDKGDSLVVLLTHACPVERDVDSFLKWFGELTPGGAYDAVCQYLPSTDIVMPRDFPAWRDRTVRALQIWNDAYFRELDAAILSGLRDEADRLRSRLGSAPPSDFIEATTNGLRIEAAPDVRRVILVPQFHKRPYNEDATLHDGLLVLYPADILPSSPDAPPAGLLRLTRGLGDDSRLRMLRFLANGPCTLTEVARFAGLTQPTVHHHLTQLRVAGLVRVHCSTTGANRYTLRPHAIDNLARQLGAYLEPEKGAAR